MAISVLILASRALAVENNGGFNATAPTNADIPGWTAGWPSVGTTGWDYVGQAGSASGVYMGNSWVLTAGHVGPHTFTLGETAYSPAANSAVGFQRFEWHHRSQRCSRSRERPISLLWP